MSRHWLNPVGVVVALAIVVVTVLIAIALPTGHYPVGECLRPDHRCVGEEDFRYPQRIAILVVGAVVSGLVLHGVRQRSRLASPTV